jgi:hypothetical protein
MTIMPGKVYAALRAAGAPDQEAMAAAEEMGGLHDQFGVLVGAMQDLRADMKAELQNLRADMKAELQGVRGELAEMRSEYRGEAASLRGEIAYLRGRFDILIWAVGINAATTIAILGVLLRH